MTPATETDGERRARAEQLQGARGSGRALLTGKRVPSSVISAEAQQRPPLPRPTPLPGASPVSIRGQPPPRCLCGCHSEGPACRQPEAPAQDSIKCLGSLRARDGSRPVRSAICRDSQRLASSEKDSRGGRGLCTMWGPLSLVTTGQAEGSSPLRRIQKLATQVQILANLPFVLKYYTTINTKAKPRLSGREVQKRGDIRVPMAIHVDVRQKTL